MDVEFIFSKIAKENVCVIDEIKAMEVELFFEDLVYLHHLYIGGRVVLIVSSKHRRICYS